MARSRESRAAQKAAFERRVWRLALLLTGTPDGAARTLDGVARAARDLSTIDAVHLDRLIVLHAREVVSRPPKAKLQDAPEDQPAPSPAAAETLGVLTEMKPQAREAWVLSRVDDLDPIHVARAMDASRTASTNFLHAAEAHLEERLEGSPAIDDLRTWIESFDPDPWLLIHRRRAKHRRRRKWIVVAAVAGAIAIVGLIVVGAL